MVDFGDAVLGAVAGLAATVLFHPVAERLERASRRLWRVNPLLVHVERDPEVIWAGSPPWVGTSVWLPDHVTEHPPSKCMAWSQWARRRSGHDADLTFLEITLQARKDTSLVIGTPIVRQRTDQVLGGRVLQCPVGGADLEPRRIELDLDTFGDDHALVDFIVDGESSSFPTVALAPGDIERFHIWARARTGRHQRRLELPVLVDGRRRVVNVDDGGDPFVTVGSEGLPVSVAS
jgi:hypothetical protein